MINIRRLQQTIKCIKKASSINNMNALIQAIGNDQDLHTKTLNNAKTLKSTGDAVLNLFSLGGSLRLKGEKEIIDLFESAWQENQDLALKCLFYLRDVRGGQGERRTFRTCLTWLANNHPNVISKNLQHIPFFGRFDDLYSLFNTPVEAEVLNYLYNQFCYDVKYAGNPKSISLLAKWLPSCNTSSRETRKLAVKIREHFNLSEREYRKSLSFLRGKLDVVEKKMSRKDWSNIVYSHVPSRASLIYRKAFGKRDKERYALYLKDVAEGKQKINASVLYPHDIAEKVLYNQCKDTLHERLALNNLWNNLPNFVSPEYERTLVVADVSGSMATPDRAIAKSVGLAIYFAERNKGVFQDCFFTFSENPELCKLIGSDIYEKVNHLNKGEWGASTNLQSVFDLILHTARKNSVPSHDMPSRLLIVSDMEFNTATGHNQSTNFEEIQAKYASFGYTMPVLVFWNVSCKTKQFPVAKDEENTILLSGSSPSILKYIFKGEIISPYEAMLEVLNNERYSVIN